MRVGALLLFSLGLVASLAPLLVQREPIDQDGLRSYFVIFNNEAPLFGHDVEKLRSWLQQEIPAVNTSNIQHAYEVVPGFSVWLTPEALLAIREHPSVDYVEEDQVMRIPEAMSSGHAINVGTGAAFTTRQDWGQFRTNQNSNTLSYTPTSPVYFTNGVYPNGSADTTVWNWATGAQRAFLNTGSKAVIWVLDTGILSSHQEFSPNRVRYYRDFVTTGGTAQDCNGHGTHVAGSAAGNYRGVANAAQLGAVRVLNCQGSGTNANVVAGIDYIAANAVAGMTNILSASLGGGASTTTNNAIDSAARTVVTVVAAGNDAANACNYSPAGATSAITVGATDGNTRIATFSNYGTCLNVFAPGVSIHSAWYTSSTTYNTISGTSMATPLVSGSLAVYASTLTSTLTNSAATSAIRTYSKSNMVTGTLNSSPNLFIYSRWASA